MKNYSVLIALPVLCAFSAAFAQNQKFTVDPGSSDVAMTLGASDHATHGTFHVESGSINIDVKAAKMSGIVAVAAGSGKTGNDTRDKKMTTEVLDATHFSQVTFSPQSYQGTIATTGDSTVQVTGVFTLHGAAHDLTIPMQIHVEGQNCIAKTHFVVPYVKWGLKDPSIFILKVAKEVDIDLKLSGSLVPSS